MLNYNLPAPSVIPGSKNQFINLAGSINYHTGAFGVEPGWSHATAQLATPFEIATFIITPSVNYQWSFEDTVDPNNDFWVMISLAKNF